MQKKLLITILIVLAILIIALVGLLLLVPKSQAPTTTVENSQTQAQNQPSITVTSPNGGEVYKEGQPIQITWNSTGVDKVSIYASYYDINGVVDPLSPFAGGECRLTYESVPASEKTFTFDRGRCGVMPAGQRIKITITGSKSDGTGIMVHGSWLEDTSDNYFSIIQ